MDNFELLQLSSIKIWSEYQSHFSLPKILLEKDESLPKNSFTADLEAGLLRVRASNELGFSYGQRRMAIELSSGCKFWRRRVQSPTFFLRPVFLELENIDFEFSNEFIEFISERILDFGMNALCLKYSPDLSQDHLLIFRKAGLKLIIASQDYLKLSDLLEPEDYLLFEACPEAAFDSLMLERLSNQLQKIQAEIQSRLVYDISYFDEIDPQDLANFLEKDNLLSFKAHTGNNLHPFFNKIMQGQNASDPVFLPIFDSKSFGQGFWPCFPLKTLKELLQWMEHSRYAGLMTLTASLGKRNGYLDATLWMIGQSLWLSSSPDLLLQEYFAAYQINWYPKLLEKAEALLLELRDFSKEKQTLRLQAAAILAQLQVFKNFDNPLFLYFLRDLKKELFYRLKQASEILPQILEEGDLGPSFWSKSKQKSSSALNAAPSVSLLSQPEAPQDNLEMQAIFDSAMMPVMGQEGKKTKDDVK